MAICDVEGNIRIKNAKRASDHAVKIVQKSVRHGPETKCCCPTGL